MLKNAFEWLRAADLQPDDKMVTNRTQAAIDVKDRLCQSSDLELLVAAVATAVGGCERLGDQSAVVKTLLECVRAEQPAFPSALSENALHLRIVCCLGLGELIESAEEQASDEGFLAAVLLVSGLGLKSNEAGRHLDNIFDDLAALARDSLQTRAVALRKREDLDWGSFEDLASSAANPTTFNQNLLPVLRQLIETVERHNDCDREELEVMWWLYNGFSEYLGKRITEATPFLAATAIGCEIGDRVNPPGTVGLNDLVAQAAFRNRSAAKSKAKPLNKIMVDLGAPGRRLLLPKAESVKNLVHGSASVLPLTWLCMRLDESQGAAGWEQELMAKTGLAAERELTPSELAAQVFVERQAQRVYQCLTEE